MKVFVSIFLLILSFSIFGYFTFLAIKKKRNLKSSVKTLLLGTIIADFIILSSLFYFGNVYTKSGVQSEYDSVNNKSVEKPFIIEHNSEYEISNGNKIVFSIIHAFINTPKMGALGLKYPVIFSAALDFPWHLGLPYGIFFVFLSIFTPIVFGGFLVSYIKALWNFILYNLLKHFRNVYYFSELNENSMLLAEDIISQKKEKHKSLIVFCNSNKIPGIYEDRINQNFFIVLTENEKDLILKSKSRKKKQYFFEISDDDNRNLDSTRNIIKEFEKFEATFFPNVRVYLFMESYLFGSEKLFSSKHEKFNIFLIDEVKTSIFNLLFEKSLCEKYEKVNENTDLSLLYERFGEENINENTKLLSIAVIGNSAYTKEFFKNAYWASVLDDNYKTEISFINSNAESFEKSLKLNCPDMFPKNGFFKDNYKLNFFPINLQSDELNEVLDTKILSPNYILIDTGDDEENINIALYLRAFFNRNSEDFNYSPFIALRIKDSKTAKRVNNMKTDDDISYELYAFGDSKEVYSYKLIVDSPIDKLALNCHAAYNTNGDHHYETKEDADFGCNTSDFEKNSNRAAAIHIKNKLYYLGLELKQVDDEIEISENDKIENDRAWTNFDNILKMKNSPQLKELQIMEKNRWNAFHYISGWTNCTFEKEEELKVLSPTGGKPHKNVRAKMHACLCEWDKLKDVEHFYNKPFTEYDNVFIKEIPNIIGCQKNNPANIGGARFLLVERNKKGE